MNTPVRSGFVNHLLIYTLVGLGCSGSVGVGTVWLQHQISITANENKVLEARIAAVRRESLQLNAEIAFESDPAALLQRNSQMRLGLVEPTGDQMVIVNEDPMTHLRNKQGREPVSTSPATPFTGIRLALGR